ncbi:hypothetical protein [Thermococcus sp. MV5]|uniref:hypothetical protein n=1 Tax=Thermococcus sp. MV5 TaxID=1638272 RepID=UPI001F0E7759|nr:hypothetical protein [Thermococcus sp. MV5]
MSRVEVHPHVLKSAPKVLKPAHLRKLGIFSKNFRRIQFPQVMTGRPVLVEFINGVSKRVNKKTAIQLCELLLPYGRGLASNGKIKNIARAGL